MKVVESRYNYRSAISNIPLKMKYSKIKKLTS